MNARARLVIAGVLMLLGMAGCGGGEEEGQEDAAAMLPAGSAATAKAPAQVPAQAPAVTSVQLQGCVVDRHFIPAEGRVEALQADGRAVAHGDADAHGIFRLRVPPDATLRIRLAGRADSDPVEVLVLRHDLSVAACLMDEARE